MDWHARSQATTQPLTHPSPFIGMGDKIWRTKASKLRGQDKDSKIPEGKKKLSSNWKAITQQLPPADWWPSHEQWPPWKRKHSPPSCSTPAFIVKHVVIWYRISLWSIQVGWPADPSQPPAYSLVEQENTSCDTVQTLVSHSQNIGGLSTLF